MSIRTHRWFTLFLLASVFLVFILPGVSLCPTPLRAMRNAALIFFAIACAASVLRNLLGANAHDLFSSSDQDPLSPASCERSCVIRC